MEDWSYIESATIVSHGCVKFVIHQPVTHYCIALKTEPKNEVGENVLWNKIRDGLQKNYKKILETLLFLIAQIFLSMRIVQPSVLIVIFQQSIF